MGAPFWAAGVWGFERYGLRESELGAGLGISSTTIPANPFDVVRIKGLTLPGIARVKALPTQDYKGEKAPGREGTTFTLQGYLPGPIDIELLMWLPDQWTIWQSILSEIWRKPGKAEGSTDRGTETDPTAAKKLGDRARVRKNLKLAEAAAVSIESPALSPYNITRVVVVGVSPPEPGPVPQSRQVNIKCVEWVPPPPETVSASAKVRTGAKRPPVTNSFQMTSDPPLNKPWTPGGDPKMGTPAGVPPVNQSKVRF